MRTTWAWLLVPGVLSTHACAGELEGDEKSYVWGGAAASCEDVPALLAGKCGQNFCHGGTDPAQALDLRSAGVEARLVGVNAHSEGCTTRQLVAAPGTTTPSFLLEKLTSDSPECGDPMPPVGDISPGELACIERWAAALAGGAVAPPGSGGTAGTGDAGGDGS